MIISLGPRLPGGLDRGPQMRDGYCAEESSVQRNHCVIQRPKPSLLHLEFANPVCTGPRCSEAFHPLAGSSLWHWSVPAFTEYMTGRWALPTRRSNGARTFLSGSAPYGASPERSSKEQEVLFSSLIAFETRTP